MMTVDTNQLLWRSILMMMGRHKPTFMEEHIDDDGRHKPTIMEEHIDDDG